MALKFARFFIPDYVQLPPQFFIIKDILTIFFQHLDPNFSRI